MNTTDNTPATSAPVLQPTHTSAELMQAMRAAFEYGHKCAEKGMNIQAAFIAFDKTMAG